MLTYLILIAWCLFALISLAMICLHGQRRTGMALLAGATVGALVWIAVSVLMVVLVPHLKFAKDLRMQWLVALLGYSGAIGLGSVAGTVSGVATTRKLFRAH